MNRSIRATLLAMGAATVLAPQAARAGELPLTTYCSSGALKTCAAFRIMTTEAVGGGTDVMLWVANLAGLPSYNTTASYLSKIGFSLTAGRTVGTVSGLVVTADGATVKGDAASKWVVGTSASELSLGADDFLSKVSGNPKAGAIQGCTLSSDATIYFQTCGADQFVKFSFRTSGTWSAEYAQVAWKVQGAGLDGEASLECIVGGTGDKECLPETTVPEPVTLTLLATGLVGLAGFQFVRRRRRTGEI